MKQLFLVLAFVSSLSVSVPSYAETNEHYMAGFVLPDILFYRPLGLAATAVGTAVFVAISPLTAFSQIAPPHDAFEKTAEFLIMAPARHTFARPVGDMSMSYFKKKRRKY